VAKLSRQARMGLLKTMARIRATEERILREYRAGTITGAIHLSIGQEAVAAGVCAALRDDDYVFSTHRGHGHAIAKGIDLDRMWAELMGRETGVCRGHGGSMHLFSPDKGLMGGNGIVGGGIPLALGTAFAAQYRGTDQVTVGFFSEGASNQGVFHESLNLAALWKLPVLYVCENNQYAATTPVARSCANPDIADRAAPYGIPGATVDGNDAPAVLAATQKAVRRARAGEGPTLIEAKTYRIEPHCGIIADLRTPGERERWLEQDPLGRLRGELLEAGLPAADIAAMEAEVARELEGAVAFAKAQPFPDPAAPHHASWEVTP
jgi:acetoin:2,6-dichlorophenolindophenol oxidoreductase subunit alpha